MLQKLSKLAKALLFTVLLSVCIWGITIVLMPKIPDFYQEEEWDVVFFGSSQSYCTFDPAVFDEYGIKSYNRGRSQQPMNYTYYYVKDALDACDIDVVVLEVFTIYYGEGDPRYTEAGVRDSSLNDMRYSTIKMEAIWDCVPLAERWGYFFPLDKYHSNWENVDFSSAGALTDSLFDPYYTEESDRGFFGWEGSQATWYPVEEAENSEECIPFNEETMGYIEGIYELCQEHDAELILVKAPFPCNEMLIGETNTVEAWAEENGVTMINYMRLTDEIGLDFDTDSLDGGTHVNADGAKKVSRHLAEYLYEAYFANK